MTPAEWVLAALLVEMVALTAALLVLFVAPDERVRDWWAGAALGISVTAAVTLAGVRRGGVGVAACPDAKRGLHWGCEVG